MTQQKKHLDEAGRPVFRALPVSDASRIPEIVSEAQAGFPELAVESRQSLDLFSTRHALQKKGRILRPEFAERLCSNGAPFIAIKTDGKIYRVTQGCCNCWTCPRCGLLRAKREYGRIMAGCRQLAAEHDLYFLTLTCCGRELSLADADANYYKWTTRLLNRCRDRARRSGQYWSYVQLTERQQRGHPHSHLITSFVPHDVVAGERSDWVLENGQFLERKIPALRSPWLRERCLSAGLGSEYDISPVRSVAAASCYVAKYLFKLLLEETRWPKHWRRVRYSRSFPKLPARPIEAFPLLKKEDWARLVACAVVVVPVDNASQERCREMLRGNDVLMRSLPFQA